MNQNLIIERLKGEKPFLMEHGVTHLAIFGSRARDDARADSDLDLLFDVPSPSDFSLLDLVGIERHLSERLGLKANAFMRRSLDDQFRQTIDGHVIEVF